MYLFVLVFDNGNGLDLLLVKRLIHKVCSYGSDSVYNLDAFNNLTECSVGAVKELGVLVNDKELRGCGVGVVGACH